MVFYLLISIVFLAEIIIAATVLVHLVKLDNAAIAWNKLLNDIKPQISEIMNTFKKLSEQMLELAPILVEKIKDCIIKLALDQLKGILAGLTFWSVKKEVEKRIN